LCLALDRFKHHPLFHDAHFHSALATTAAVVGGSGDIMGGVVDGVLVVAEEIPMLGGAFKVISLGKKNIDTLKVLAF